VNLPHALNSIRQLQRLGFVLSHEALGVGVMVHPNIPDRRVVVYLDGDERAARKAVRDGHRVLASLERSGSARRLAAEDRRFRMYDRMMRQRPADAR
jgi:hypothetical protein